jgi:hypothetical protein
LKLLPSPAPGGLPPLLQCSAMTQPFRMDSIGADHFPAVAKHLPLKPEIELPVFAAEQASAAPRRSAAREPSSAPSVKNRAHGGFQQGQEVQLPPVFFHDLRNRDNGR